MKLLINRIDNISDPGKVKMVPKANKKSRANLINLVKPAGWKDDPNRREVATLRAWLGPVPATSLYLNVAKPVDARFRFLALRGRRSESEVAASAIVCQGVAPFSCLLRRELQL